VQTSRPKSADAMQGTALTHGSDFISPFRGNQTWFAKPRGWCRHSSIVADAGRELPESTCCGRVARVEASRADV